MKEIKDLHQLRLAQAKNCKNEAIKEFIMNDSKNQLGVWEWLSGWGNVNGEYMKIHEPASRVIINELEKLGFKLEVFNCHQVDSDLRTLYTWVFYPANAEVPLSLAQFEFLKEKLNQEYNCNGIDELITINYTGDYIMVSYAIQG